ncbi:hypothetical protein BHE74_00027695 [Ensete ventricosum]|nr:hypothetical protein BHE74_00027695 [Ensete ventricosum]
MVVYNVLQYNSPLTSRTPLQCDNSMPLDNVDSYSVASYPSSTFISYYVYLRMVPCYIILNYFMANLLFVQKVPPTRAKSPNLTRRKSYGDAKTTEEDYWNGGCGRFHRHNPGANREATKKLQNSAQNIRRKVGLKSKSLAVATNRASAGVIVQM